MILQIFVAVCILFLVFILFLVLYYVSAAYQSTTTITRPCNFWYYDGAYHNVIEFEVTIAGTLKKKSLSSGLEETMDKFVDKLHDVVYIKEPDLVLVTLPSNLSKYGKRPCKGGLESITHQLFLELMNTEKKYRRWITQLRLRTSTRSVSINRYKPTNFVL